MAQVLEFKLPDLGEGLTEAEIVRWLVQVGDVVAIDQPVVEVETAKAMVEVPCPYGGVVTARFGEEGTELPVGAPLLTVAVGAPASGALADEGSGNVLVGYGTGAPPARRRRVRPGEPIRSGAPATPAVRPTAVDTAAAQVAAPERPDGPVPVISPLVRRLARENGLDLRELHGSGPEGLILRADVEHALRAVAAPVRAPQPVTVPGAQPAPVAAPARAESPSGTRVPLRGVRGAVADKLSRSRREIPDATCWVDADATELMNARTAMNAAGGPKVSSSHCSHASALQRWPASRSSTRRSTWRPARSYGSTRCTSGSPRRRNGGWSCPSYGTRTPGTRSRSAPSSPG